MLTIYIYHKLFLGLYKFKTYTCMTYLPKLLYVTSKI